MILAKGADIDIVNQRNPLSPRQETPLQAALRVHQCDMVALLLKRGALANSKEQDQGLAMPILLAVDSNCPRCISLLVKHGASTKSRNGQGLTALHTAVILRHLQAVEALIQNGADPMEPLKKNYRPIHIAAQVGSPVSHNCFDPLSVCRRYLLT